MNLGYDASSVRVILKLLFYSTVIYVAPLTVAEGSGFRRYTLQSSESLSLHLVSLGLGTGQFQDGPSKRVKLTSDAVSKYSSKPQPMLQHFYTHIVIGLDQWGKKDISVSAYPLGTAPVLAKQV